MQNQLMPVPFYDDTVVLVGQDNEPLVAMKPIVTNMGLDWNTQWIKLTEKFGSTMGIIPTVAEDGKTREMICLPLRKLPAWLYSINPNKVKPELRDKVVRYQEECDDALWAYWTKGSAARPGLPNIGQQLAVSRHRTALLKELHRTRDRAMREALHEQLAHASRLIGLSVPELDTIGRAAPEDIHDLEPFWQALNFLTSKGERFDHSPKPHIFMALRLDDLQKRLDKHSGPNVLDSSLRYKLKHSTDPRCLEDGRTIQSVLLGKSLRCLIFEPWLPKLD